MEMSQWLGLAGASAGWGIVGMLVVGIIYAVRTGEFISKREGDLMEKRIADLEAALTEARRQKDMVLEQSLKQQNALIETLKQVGGSS